MPDAPSIFSRVFLAFAAALNVAFAVYVLH